MYKCFSICDVPPNCFFRHLIKKWDTLAFLCAKMEVEIKSAKNQNKGVKKLGFFLCGD